MIGDFWKFPAGIGCSIWALKPQDVIRISIWNGIIKIIPIINKLNLHSRFKDKTNLIWIFSLSSVYLLHVQSWSCWWSHSLAESFLLEAVASFGPWNLKTEYRSQSKMASFKLFHLVIHWICHSWFLLKANLIWLFYVKHFVARLRQACSLDQLIDVTCKLLPILF